MPERPPAHARTPADARTPDGGWGPFGRLAPARMRRLLWVSGVAAGLLFVALAVLDTRIMQNEGPGIIGLEVAGTPERATEILGEWGSEGRDAARLSLYLDFPFLVLYAIFFGAACTAMGRRLRAHAERGGRAAAPSGHLAGLAPGVGWAFVVAAVLDLAENIALLQVVDYSLVPWTRMAQLTASPKLAIFAAGLFFLAGAALLTARSPQRGR